MRILSFSHDGTLYGAQRSLIGLLRGLQHRSHEILLAIPGPGALYDHAREQGIPARIVPYPFPSTKPLRALQFILDYPAAARRIRKLVNEVGPDIVHFNTAACLTPAAALRKSEVKRVWHLRETLAQKSLLEGVIAPWSNFVIFNSNDTAAHHPKLKALRNSAVVYNGIETPHQSPDEITKVRSEFSWNEGDTIVVFVGQLRPFKDPMALVEAVRILNDRGLSIKAAIVGDGPLLSALQSAVSRHSLESQISISGYRTDAVTIMAAADIVVCPSLRESFGRTALEAMTLGVPVIAAQTGGLPEIVIHGQTGLLTPPGDHPALADALEKLAVNARTRKEFGLAGLKRFEQVFTVDNYVDSMESIFLSLIME